MRDAIDVNCDLGEVDGGPGASPDASRGAWAASHEPALLALVTSANVACGGHAGDDATMRAVCEAAARRGVSIGAQVSYEDRAGFGRVFRDVEPHALAASIRGQWRALDAHARAAGARVAYVKPHGALYNAIVRHEAHARVVVGLAREAGVPLMCLPGALAERLAGAAGVRYVREWFADRGYRADGTLVPRGEPGALVTDPAEVSARVADVLRASPRPDSICVHSDTPGAATLLAAVRDALGAAGVTAAPSA